MRKVISLLMIYAVLAISVPSQAQFQTPSPNVVFSPAAVTATATCTTTGCPTFTLPAMCTATVRLTGTNSAISIVAQVSNDGGTTYSPVFPTIPSTGVTNPAVNGVVTTATGAMTQGGTGAPGLYVIQVLTMNRIRFIIGTLTGTNVTIKLVAASNCNGQTL
jgi:hypothetical protein